MKNPLIFTLMIFCSLSFASDTLLSPSELKKISQSKWESTITAELKAASTSCLSKISKSLEGHASDYYFPIDSIPPLTFFFSECTEEIASFKGFNRRTMIQLVIIELLAKGYTVQVDYPSKNITITW